MSTTTESLTATPARSKLTRNMALVALAAAIASLVFAFRAALFCADCQKPLSEINWCTKLKAFVLGVWVLLPPVWFWYEYFVIYFERRQQNLKAEDRRSIEEFKHQQDQSAKIWLALVSMLLLLFFGKDIKG